MKRIIPLLLSAALLLSGCVGTAAPALSNADGPSQAAPAQPDTPDVPPPAEPEVQAPAEVEEEEPYVRIIDPTGPMVALTFDDGPHATYTDQILDILEENHALATFFEVGRNVAACPEPVARMAEMGCEVGSHSNAHKDLSKLKRSALLQDLQTADDAFTAAMGRSPTLVRPPYGSVNKTVKYSTGRSMITWTVDTLDWSSRDAQTVIDYVKGLGSLDGEIVLMHSTYESTVDAVRELVPWLQEQGYQLVTVSELMAYYYGELLEPNQFYGYTYFTTHGRTDTPAELPEEPWTVQIPEEAPVAEEPVQSPAAPTETPPVSQPPAEAPPEETPPAESTPPSEEEAPSPGDVPPPEEAPPVADEPSLPPEEEPTQPQLPEDSDPSWEAPPAEGPADAEEPVLP